MGEQLLRVLEGEVAEDLDTLCAQLLEGQVVLRGKTALWIRRLTPDVLGDGEPGLPLERPRIARLLDDAGLSNGEVAAALDTTTVTVSRWRSGRVVPPVTSALRLATFVGVPVEAIEWSLDEGFERAKPQSIERDDREEMMSLKTNHALMVEELAAAEKSKKRKRKLRD